MMPSAVAVVAVWAIARILVTPLMHMLIKGQRLLRPNYRGDQVPVGMGLLIPLAVLPASLLWQGLMLRTQAQISHLFWALILVLTGFPLLGLLDDSVGNGEARGIKGHLGCLCRGELTTGGLKAIYGVVLALFIAWLAPIRGSRFQAVAIMCLMTNAINLFDLRPGRALKIFFLSYITIAVSARSWGGPLVLVPVTALVLFPWDLRARAMLGDTGANVLGAVLGVFMIVYLSIELQWAVLVALTLLHVYAEKFSITALIEKVPLLHWLDMLGRHQTRQGS